MALVRAGVRETTNLAVAVNQTHSRYQSEAFQNALTQAWTMPTATVHNAG